MKHQYVIEDEKIILRPMDMERSELYRKLRNREDNRNFFFHSQPVSKEDQERWFNNYLEKDNELMFYIQEALTEKFIGGIGIYDIDTEKRTAEVGRILIDRYSAGGNGYGGLAIKMLSEKMMQAFGLKELYAFIYSDNIASQKSFAKAGYSVVSNDDKTVKAVLLGQ